VCKHTVCVAFILAVFILFLAVYCALSYSVVCVLFCYFLTMPFPVISKWFETSCSRSLFSNLIPDNRCAVTMQNLLLFSPVVAVTHHWYSLCLPIEGWQWGEWAVTCAKLYSLSHSTLLIMLFVSVTSGFWSWFHTRKISSTEFAQM